MPGLEHQATHLPGAQRHVGVHVSLGIDLGAGQVLVAGLPDDVAP